MSLVRVFRVAICSLYWLGLTVLLLVPNPARALGMRRVLSLPWGDLGIHFAAFTLLTLLVCVARWPRPIGWPMVALTIYAVTIESLQALVPPRTVELKDFAENVLGIAVGLGVYWCARKMMGQAGAERISTARRVV